MTTNHEGDIDDLLHRGVERIIEEKTLRTKLHRRRPLRVKLGIDPTGYQLHLGHVVPLRKLRAWQNLGHQAVLIIGDYTAQIGDPSGREKSRLALSPEQTKKFSGTYLDQVGRILDLKKTEVRYNSEWYDRFTVRDFVGLIGRATVNQMLAHETFRQRIDRGQPLGMQELTYPLLQGYDSVAVEADVELGGVDQTFNLLTGRDVQQAYKQDPQDVMTLAYLIGTDGKKKMSKTENNIIALDDSANEMFGKAMSLPDKLIVQYFELCTDLPPSLVAEVKRDLRKKTTNPRDAKIRLAKDIVRQYHGQRAADEAAADFGRVFRQKGAPTSMPTIELRPGDHQLLNVLVSHRLADSRSAARRLIEQGGVKIDRRVMTDWQANITVRDGMVIQVGKRKFARITLV